MDKHKPILDGIDPEIMDRLVTRVTRSGGEPQ